MSSVYLARTNQKLSFVRLHIEKLKLAQSDTSWHKHALIESFNESVLFHLASAYDAFLKEIAERYSVAPNALTNFDALVTAIESTGVESPEVKELAKLEADDASWLHKMLHAYEACWQGADKPVSTHKEHSVSEIHVVQINPDHAEDEEIIAEYEAWLVSLSEVINRLREGMQEW